MLCILFSGLFSRYLNDILYASTIGSYSSNDSKNTIDRCLGFLSGTSGKELTCKCRRHKRPGFDPWVGKIPWRMAWKPTPVLLPG